MSTSGISTRARKQLVAVLATVGVALSALGFSPVTAANAAAPTLSYVGSASTSGARTSHSVRVPATVQSGDTLLIFLTVNSVSGTLGSPAGWTLLQTRDGASSRGRAWTKKAVAADANALVAVPTSATLKSTMAVAAYRSSAGTSAVTASASTGATTSTTTHTTLPVSVAQANSWLVSSWSEKSSSTSTWAPPATSTSRTTAAATGGGKVSSLLADSNAAVPTGNAAGRTATTSVAGGNTQLFSVVVSPGLETTPTNQPPVPSFTTSCTNLTCSFNGGGTTDPENDALSYAWAFGDGATGTGVTASRTYGSAGTRTVTLTVNDGTTSVQTTRTVSPTNGTATATLSHIGTASAAGNRTGHTVRIPTTVRVGDTLVLFMTTNSLSGTLGSPTGWTQLQANNGTATRGRAWTKQATATDANALVTVTSTTTIKDTMSVSAYRSTGGNPSVTASAQTSGTTSTTNHTSPSVSVAQPGSWLVNSWSEKSSTTQTWTPPAGSTSRAVPAATGSGKVSSLMADSNGPVATGTATGRLARTSTAGGGTQLFSVVITPGTATPNRAPVASFTSDCTLMTCSFDAVGSSDADNDPLTYAWDFGDGTSGTGVTTSRTFTAEGARTVTLTVDDGTTTARTERSVSPVTRLPGPGHTAVVPETPRTDMPKISNGEIFDIEIVGNRVIIVGSFTTIQNQRSDNTTTYTRNGLASYNMNTGLVDTDFNPVFAGGDPDAVEATPDGTKLYVTGSFNSVNGTTRRGLARLDLSTGAPVAAFVTTLSARGSDLAASNSTVYVGGRFTTVNGVARVSLAAVDATTGAVDTGFVNNLSGGIGNGGALTVQQLVLTHDLSKLLVVFTGRQVNGQDRYGMALINTETKALLPWRTRLYQDNIQFTGGVTGINAGDISPDDEYFAVGNAWGDRPPIGDTVIAFPIAGGNDVQPLWITRHHDSVYSIAISEKAVYVGGHFSWEESPTSPDPWPGLDDVGYGTGQGISGYALGDAVVNRERVGALNPADGRALDWNPGSIAYEGNKALALTPRGLFVGGDTPTQGGYNVGRVAFYDFDSVPAGNGVETAITEPISGRVNPTAEQWLVKGTAEVPSGSVARVDLEVYDRVSEQYLADDMTSWSSSFNAISVNLASTGARSTDWSLPLTIVGNRKLLLRARTVSSTGSVDPTKAAKKTETFGFTDQPPNTDVTGPSSTLVKSKTFTVTGTATDDVGVNSIGLTILDAHNQYLQADGSVDSTGHTFRIAPDVVGATNTTWSKEITVPVEGTWKARARATDTNGVSDLDTGDRSWIVSEDGAAPTVSISAPATMVPPTAAPALSVAPGSPLTFSGSAEDDGSLNKVQIRLRNSTTRENLGIDGTWSTDVPQDWYTISPVNLDASSYNWNYTTPFNLKPGSYSFEVMATDDLGLTTASASQGKLTVNAQVPGDAPPDARLNVTGTVTGGQSLQLDLAGTATDNLGVSAVRVSLFDGDTSKYVQANGTLSTEFATLPATLATPDATSTTWTYGVALPQGGDYNVTAYAFDTVNQQDTSTSGATARYRIYPGDAPPTMTESVLAPPEGTTFPDGRIFISGRSEDDHALQNVEVAVVDSLGRYMNSSGGFPNTTASWRAAFVTSPGAVGSNFSFTTPVVPPGNYTVRVRGIDNHDQVTPVPSERHVTVTHPDGNNAPVADFSISCNQNDCTYDGRSSTDENAATLAYAWNYGNGTGSGALPTRTYTTANTYTVTLTVTDEWGIASAPVSKTVTITEPTDNVAPTPVINPPACTSLTCNFSGVGSADSNAGDSFTYKWDFGNTAVSTSTSSAVSRTFPGPGTYTVTLTTTDGWGKLNSVTRDVTFTEPANNVAPTPVINPPACTNLTCNFSSAGSADSNTGDTFTYRWDFGTTALSASTSANPSSRTFPAAGTYTVTLTTTDGWGKAATITRDVTVPIP